MTFDAILTIVATHPLQVLLLGVLVIRGIRGAVALLLDGLRADRPDAGSPPLGALVPVAAPARRFGCVTAADRRPAAGTTRQPVIL